MDTTVIHNAEVLISGKYVKRDFIFTDKILSKTDKAVSERDLSGFKIIPSLIDLHTHGANGYDFNSADSFEKLDKITGFYLKNGVTGVLATVMTDDKENIIKQLKIIAEYSERHPEILGIHLEGPFLSEKYRGAQRKEHLLSPSVEVFKEFYEAAKGKIKYLTIAPELENADKVIEYAVKNNVVVSLGHSDADYETAKKAIKLGALGFTHTFNAMRPLEHHTPSIVAAALASFGRTEIIPDGRHLNKGVVEMTYRAIKKGYVIGITDSIAATNLPDGEYSLAGSPVTVKGLDATVTGTSTRAGSVLTAFKGVKNIAEFCNISFEEALNCYTANPSEYLNLPCGTLDYGKNADFIVMKNEEIESVYLHGKEVFKR